MTSPERHPDLCDKVREALDILGYSLAPEIHRLCIYRGIEHYRTGDGIEWPIDGLENVATPEALQAAWHGWDDIFRPHLGPLAHRRVQRILANAITIQEHYAGLYDDAPCQFPPYEALAELERLLSRFSAYAALEQVNGLKRETGALVYGQPAAPLPLVNPLDSPALIHDAHTLLITEGLSLEIVLKRRIEREPRPDEDDAAGVDFDPASAGPRMSAPVPPELGADIDPDYTPAGLPPGEMATLRMCATATRNGIIAAQWGQIDQALEHFKHAYELNPAEPTTRRNLVVAYNDRGNRYARSGDDAAAIADYDAAVALDPEYESSYVNRGVAYERMGLGDRAVADYTDAITRDPYQPTAYMNRGNHYIRRGQPQLAIDDYTTAISLDGYDAGAYDSRGKAHTHNEDYPAAIADFDITLDFEPNHAIVLTDRGTAYALHGSLENAIADYTAAMAQRADYPVPSLNRACAHLDAGDFTKAAADFEHTIDIHPDCPPAYAGLDQALRLRDELYEYDRAIASAPHDWAPLRQRGLYHLARADYPRAIADFTAALARQPDPADAAPIHSDRGLAHALQRDDAAAMPDYERALALDPSLPEAWHNRALAHRRAGRETQAEHDFHRALALRPEYNAARHALRLADPNSRETPDDPPRRPTDRPPGAIFPTP